ncbi:MAG: DUF4167 domain-containing protein [Sphingorhabdus sp.]
MNNNSNRQPNNNNRRRGRNNNNNRQQQNNRSGFDYQNSIDNRARGNASQMLEKYKKLASDAQFNGDRVNAEYHLQFADHYFRVLADFRSRQEVRQDEQQNRRPREDRDDWQNDDRNAGDNNVGYDEQDTSEATGNETETAADNDGEDRRPQRDNRPRRNDRNERTDRAANDRNGNRAPRRHHSEEEADEAAGLDIAVLPPSIAIANDFDEVETEIEAEVKAKPVRKPRARRPKSANDEAVITAAE